MSTRPLARLARLLAATRRNGPGGRSRVWRLGAAGSCCALAIALVPGLHVQVGPGRAPAPGQVHDLVLRLDGGDRMGQLQAQGAGLEAAAGRTGAWLSEVLATGAARMLGISWKRQAGGPWSAPGAAEVWYRTATATATAAGTGWSGWERAAPDGASPERGSADDTRRDRVFSEPVWLPDGVAAVQVRVEFPGLAAGAVDDLVVHLVEPDMAPTPELAPPGAAVAAPAKPVVISRARWGADERLRGAPSYGKPVSMGFLHHTVQSNRYTRAQSAALVRADYLYHVRTRGWSDVGYNFLVDRYGQIFEGRAGGIDRSVLGAHTGGFNSGSFGVALIGEFTQAPVPAPAVAALKRLFAWKLDVHHVDPLSTTVMRSAGSANGRYKAGQLVRLKTISGHRDVSKTACPGARAYALLPGLRRAASSIGRPKIYGGTPSAGTINIYGLGKSSTLAPRFSQSVRWTATAVAADGQVARRWGGIGRSARFTWDGRLAGGQPAASGMAMITVTAKVGGKTARPLEARVRVNADPPVLAPVDGTSLTTGERVAGGARWPYAGAAERAADAGPSAPVPLKPGQARLLSSPLAGFPDGILVRARGTGLYLVSDGRRRLVTGRAALDAHGLGAAPVTSASAANLARLAEGPPLGAGDPLPDGVLLAAGSRAWRIEDGRARPVVAAAVAAWKARVPPATAGGGVAAASAYPTGKQLGFPEGTLLRTRPDGRVWVISDGARRHVLGGPALAAHGFARAAIRLVRAADVSVHQLGADLGPGSAPPSGTLIRVGRSTRLVVGGRGLPVPGTVIGAWRPCVNRVSGTVAARLGRAVRSFPDGTLLDAGDRLWVVSGGHRRMVAGTLARGVLAASPTRPFSHTAFSVLPLGPPVDAAAPVPDETLWRWQADGRLYRIEEGRTRRVAADAEVSWQPLPVSQAPAGWAPFASLPHGPAIGWRDGALVRSTANGRVWAVAGGQRRWVSGASALARAGLPRASIVPGSEASLALHRRGPDLR